MKVRIMMIIGAGFMGAGIAQVSAAAGHKVLLWDITEEAARAGVEKIATSLDKRIEQGKLTEAEKNALLGNIMVIRSLAEGKHAELVIEAVTEDLTIKSRIFKECDQLCSPQAIFASNTSAIPITSLANATTHPDRFIGLHFFSPVPAMKLVEIVRGMKTSGETIQSAKEFIESIHKTGILVKDGPGFLVNRVMHAFRNEVLTCLEEGVASMEDIDTAVKLGLGHPLGPFELNDFAGIDIGAATIETLYENFKDPKWRPHLSVKRLVEAGELGRKTGKGWYDYTSGEKKVRTDISFH